MQVFCSNCNTSHDVSYRQANNGRESVIHCRKCDKKIKFQFCPHCGAFYSVTFSDIRPGRYRYSCKRCMNDFVMEFADDAPATVIVPAERTESAEKPVVSTAHVRAAEPAAKKNEQSVKAFETPEKPAEKKGTTHPVKDQRGDEKYIYAKPETAGKIFDRTNTVPEEKPVLFISNSINTFTTAEIFRTAFDAFTFKKIIIAGAGVLVMMMSLQLFSSIETLFIRPGRVGLGQFAGSVINLFPMALAFSFYTLFAAVVSKLTLDKIFHSAETTFDGIIRFILKTGPAVFIGNIFILLTVSSILILFGRIPFFGPLLFSLAFLPVYLISISIFMLCFVGLWFYPPIAAHRESGIFGSFRNLFIFIRKHNFSILFMIPVIFLAAGITFSALFFVHLSAFSLTIGMSRWLLDHNASVILSSIPALFIRASEATFAGLSSGIFKELNSSLLMTHHMGGFILGAVFILITILLLSIALSITATISSHIYIVMERGITIDDRKKVTVLSILLLMMILLAVFRRMV